LIIFKMPTLSDAAASGTIAGRRLTAAHRMSAFDLLSLFSRAVSRDAFFAGLFILLCTNGLAARVFGVIHVLGSLQGVLATFNISVFVWIACIAGPWLLLSSKCEEKITTADAIVGLAAMGFALVPLASLSWLALAGLALYVLWHSHPGSERRRGALILLALTGPMLWGPLLIDMFAQLIARADAIIVADLIGTQRLGNVINFVHETKTFQVAPGCSSLHGVSLAVLAWMTITKTIRPAPSPCGLGWCALAVLSVVAVNDFRLCLIGLYPAHFDTIHGTFGSMIVSWASFALIVTISLLGVRREIFTR